MAQQTFSPDPPTLAVGAGTAASQAARARAYADSDGTGWTSTKPAAKPTSATAGIPGAWIPSGCYAPFLKELGTTPAPTPPTPFTTGQYLVTRDLFDVYWDGTKWVKGKAP